MSKIDELKEERRLLLKRVAVIDDVIAEYVEWEKRVALLLPMPTTDRSGPVVAHSDLPGLVSQVEIPHHQESINNDNTVGKNATPMPEFIAAVEAVLERTERPLVRSAFLEALDARGVVVGGKDPRNTLSTRLTRIPNVMNIEGHGFWRRDRHYPPAGYAPLSALLDDLNDAGSLDQAENH